MRWQVYALQDIKNMRLEQTGTDGGCMGDLGLDVRVARALAVASVWLKITVDRWFPRFRIA